MLAPISHPNWAVAPAPPFSVCPVYSYLNFRKLRLTFSVRRSSPLRSARRNAADDNLLKRDLDIFERDVSAGLADGQHALGDMLALGAGLDQIGRRFVGPMREVQIVNADLAGAATPAVMLAAGLIESPGPAQNVNLILVL